MKGYQAHALQINHCNVMYSVDGNDETIILYDKTRQRFVYWLAGYSGCRDNDKTKYCTIISKENMTYIFTTAAYRICKP